MFEVIAAVPWIWTSMNSWLSPTVLFILLNVMIGTIALASSLTGQKQQTRDDPHHQQQQQPGVARSPSVLQRLRSISFHSYRSQEPNPSFFNSTHFKQPSDSDTHYPSEHSHQHQALETETPFLSQQTHEQQTQFVSQQTHEQETQFVYQQTHEQETQFDSQQIHEQETQFDSQQTHEQETQFDSQQTHEQETQFVSQQTHEQETQFFSQQTHEQATQKTETQFVPEQALEDDEEEEQRTMDQKTETQFVPEQGLEDDEDEEQRTMDEIYSQMNDRHVNRSKSDTSPASGELPRRLTEKMRKSASSKSAFGHFEEMELLEARRPATVRERNIRSPEEDEEVDAKADDFINKFKQQLKLQRLDSLLRFRGSGR